MSPIIPPSVPPALLAGPRALVEDAKNAASLADQKAAAAQSEIADLIANPPAVDPYPVPHRMMQAGVGRDPDSGLAVDPDAKALFRVMHAAMNPPDPMQPVYTPPGGGPARTKHAAITLVEMLEGAGLPIPPADMADLRAKAEAVDADPVLAFCGKLDDIARNFLGGAL